MRVLFEPAPVYFMHVPKTGGTTLAQWLRSAYGRGFFDLNLPQITRLANRDVRGFRCYHSWHHGRSLFDWLGRANLTVITILRDPVERAASAFGHRQRAHAQHPERFKPEFQARFRALPETDLREFLDDDLTIRDYSNAQPRLLGGRKDYGAFLAAVAQAEPAAQAEALLRPYRVPPITDMHDLPLLYANACAWLDEMAVVGLTERYAESMFLVGDLLGIPLPADMPRANVNPQRTDLAMRYQDRLAPDVVARLLTGGVEPQRPGTLCPRHRTLRAAVGALSGKAQEDVQHRPAAAHPPAPGQVWAEGLAAPPLKHHALFPRGALPDPPRQLRTVRRVIRGLLRSN